MAPRSRREILKAGGLAVGGALATSGAVAGTTYALAGTGGSADAPTVAASPWDQVPVILGRIKPPTFRDEDFNITKFGAVGNGSTDCTAAFRQAIAACNKAGGGRVVVPAGTS